MHRNLVLFVLCFLLLLPVSVSADEWLSGYSYRKQVNITGQSGAGTDYVVELEIGSSSGGDFHLEGHCENFPNDIRFTDNDSVTVLSYWIENTSADPITVHVKVTDDLSSNQSIYCYYGKSGDTTTSDGDDVFDFFDDFVDNSSLSGESFTAHASMPAARSDTRAAEIDGKIYVPCGQDSGGNDQNNLYIYNISSNSWSTGANAPAGREDIQIGEDGSHVYVIGGKASATGDSVNTVWSYDIATNTWSTKTSMLTGVANAAYAQYDGKVYIISGDVTNTQCTNKTQVYDMANDSWEYKADFPDSLKGPSAGIVDGKIYVFGGYRRSDAQLNTAIYCYDIATNTWSTKSATWDSPKDCVTVQVKDGKIYLWGGLSQNLVFEYNPSTDIMTEKGSLSDSYSDDCPFCEYGGELWVPGGSDASGNPTNDVRSADLSQVGGAKWSHSVETAEVVDGALHASDSREDWYAVESNNSVDVADKALEMRVKVTENDDKVRFGIDAVSGEYTYIYYFNDNDIHYGYNGPVLMSNYDYNYHTFRIYFKSSTSKTDVWMDGTKKVTDSDHYVSSEKLVMPNVKSYNGTSDSYVDWVRVRKFVDPEPDFSSAGAEEETSVSENDYIPPDPTNLQHTISGTWVNYTWSAGTGNVTDSYNVSVNGVWTNGTTDVFKNCNVGYDSWANITVYAFNSSGNGTLSLGSVSDNVKTGSAPEPDDYIPPDPTNLQHTISGTWVNYTWSAGTGNVTDSYNVSVNGVWTNGTTDNYMNCNVGYDSWANITVWAFNASGNGTLSIGSISDNVKTGSAPSYSDHLSGGVDSPWDPDVNEDIVGGVEVWEKASMIVVAVSLVCMALIFFALRRWF